MKTPIEPERLSHLRRYRPFYRRLAINLAVGLLIEAVLSLYHHHPYVVALENAAFDRMLALYKSTTPKRHEPKPFVFVDIDDETHKSWGRPSPLPQERIVELLEFALDGDPALVIVDVDISRDDEHAGAPTRDWVQLRVEANGAADVIHEARREARERDPTPVVFIRRIPLDVLSGHSDDPSAPPSHLDDLVPLDPRASRAPLFWGASVFGQDADWSIRRWRLWEEICVGGEPRLILGVPALAHALLEGGAEAVAHIHAEIFRPSPRICRPGVASHARTIASRIAIGGHTLEVPPSELRQRIFYTMPWRLPDGRVQARIEHRGRRTPILSIVSASTALAAGVGASRDLLKDAVVIIGGSFAEGLDLHPTPFGDMPGAVILANAINSFREHGQLEPPSRWLKLTTLVSAIFVMAVIFATASAFVARVIATVVSLGLLLPLSALVFRQGMWLDFALPLLAVEIHGLVSEVETEYEMRRSGAHSAHASKVPPWAKALALSMIAAGGVLIVTAIPEASETPEEVGYVAGFTSEEHIRWHAPDGPQKLELLKPVCAGDEFVLLDDAARLELMLGGARTKIVRAELPENTYVVPALEARPAVTIETVFDMLMDFAAPEPPDTPRVELVVAGTRGGGNDHDALAIPALVPDEQHVSGGLRRLTLSWQGEHRPFTIRHIAPGGALLFEDTRHDPRAEWGALLLPGIHKIELRDDEMYSVTAKLVVVSEHELPQRIAPPNAATSDARPLADALRLALLEDEHWRFEALLRIAALEIPDSKLATIRRDLELGRRPSLAALESKKQARSDPRDAAEQGPP